MGSMLGATPLTASSPSLKSSSVTPRKALAITSGLRGSLPLTISKTWRIFSALATELPPNFMTIIGGVLKQNPERGIKNHGIGAGSILARVGFGRQGTVEEAFEQDRGVAALGE